MADTAAIHLDNHAAGDPSSRKPAIVGVRAVPQSGVIGELLPRLQHRSIDLGKRQLHIAVAIGRIGGNRAVTGKLDKMLLQIGLGDGGLGLNEGSLNVPAPLFREKLMDALQRLGQIHPAAGLLVCEDKAVFILTGNGGVLGLRHTIHGCGRQFFLSGFRQIHDII